jgi:hypothetical protein
MGQEAKDERGLWRALYGAEIGATQALAGQLEPFRTSVEACFECGVAVPTLPHGQLTKDLKVAALFLKRSLADLRGVWLLLGTGHTSHAGAVAAAAFENALTVNAILANPQAVDDIVTNGRESPWGAAKLCKIEAGTWAALTGY